MHVVERKAGIIPTGGRLRRVYRDDSRGRGLLLGDAAGLCGAATGGGIYPALISGRLAAHAVANEVLNGDRGSIKVYLRNLSQAGRLGHYLRIEDWLRLVLDSMKSDADVGMLYSLFASPQGHQVLQRTLLETPIIAMDSSFFSLLRSLLGQHPRLYGSAFQALWQRVTTHNHP
jgi:flavin-dependent dehydrogenase